MPRPPRSDLVCRGLLLALLGVATVGAADPPPATEPTQRAMEKWAGPATQGIVPYPKRWAVVIGLNYDPKDRTPEQGKIEPLHYAENDAVAVHKVLTEKYGFEKDPRLLLVGKDAKKNVILDRLNKDVVRHPTLIGKDDCVVVYFSGHGYLRPTDRDKPSEGFLIPADAEVLPGDQFHDGTAISLQEVVKALRECKARHRLLILDSCHSGQVFVVPSEVTLARGTDDHEQDGPSLYKTPALQAMTACRAKEKALDGVNGHSPFTNALLLGLNGIPRQLSPSQRHFTASRLFTAMKAPLNEHLATQSPQYRWLDGEHGEFHLFPGPADLFPEPASSEEAKRLLMAMVPSTFGNWWADEVIWFMPGLRDTILTHAPKQRSSLDGVDAVRLREAALSASRAADAKAGPEVQARLGHLRRLLDADREGPGKLAAAMKAVAGDLEKATARKAGPDDADPLDLHFLAVLLQKQADYAAAEACYERALTRYAAAANGSARLLTFQALCEMDLGHCHLYREDKPKPSEAAQRFFAARERTRDVPVPFRVFSLVREADAHRREGHWGRSDARMDEALGLLKVMDPAGVHPLSAATWKHWAWACVGQWRFKDAGLAFGAARDVLDHPDNRDRRECEIDRLHVAHGLALIERCQGRDEAALAAYRRLTPLIAGVLAGLDREQADLPNRLQLHQLLYDRLVNSLERQADCSLFGSRPNYAEAADDYRRALEHSAHLPPDKVTARRIDLKYRQAIALAMPSPDRDLPLARHVYDQAEQLRIGAGIKAAAQPFRTRVLHALAASLLPAAATPTPPRPGDLKSVALDLLRQAAAELDRATPVPDIRDLLRDPTIEVRARFERDELERLLFAHKVLLAPAVERPLTRFERGELADGLLRLCRVALRTGSPDPELLRFLRPYFDTAFEVKVAPGDEKAPVKVKELLEIAWEATRGTSYVKSPGREAVLVLHTVNGKGYLLLDAAEGVSECVALDGSETVADFAQASAGESLLALPDATRKALRRVKTPLLLRWRDPTTQPPLGFQVERPSPERIMPVEGDDLRPSSTARFPFNVKPAAPHLAAAEEALGESPFPRRRFAAYPPSREVQLVPSGP